jgi:hypothetical protein
VIHNPAKGARGAARGSGGLYRTDREEVKRTRPP